MTSLGAVVRSSVACDARPCPFCDEPVGAKHCVVLMLDDAGELVLRWADQSCATFAAKKANPDRVMYPKYSACLRCGGTMADWSHTIAAGDAFCDHECELPWVHPTREDHADRRIALQQLTSSGVTS